MNPSIEHADRNGIILSWFHLRQFSTSLSISNEQFSICKNLEFSKQYLIKRVY